MADKEEPERKGDPGKGKGPVRLQIKAADEVARGTYANLAVVHHNDSEFVMDFVFVEPQRPNGQVVSRVVASPKTAKRHLLALQELVRRYEQRFGEIELPKAPPPQGAYH